MQQSQTDIMMESVELMIDKKFMNSYKKSKEQIRKREFADWNFA